MKTLNGYVFYQHVTQKTKYTKQKKGSLGHHDKQHDKEVSFDNVFNKKKSTNTSKNTKNVKRVTPKIFFNLEHHH